MTLQVLRNEMRRSCVTTCEIAVLLGDSVDDPETVEIARELREMAACADRLLSHPGLYRLI